MADADDTAQEEPQQKELGQQEDAAETEDNDTTTQQEEEQQEVATETEDTETKGNDTTAQEEPQQKEVRKEVSSEGEKSSKIGVLTWVIMALIVALCAGSGFVLGRLFADPEKPETVQSPQASEPSYQASPKIDESAAASKKSWYYDVKPVVANLDEQGATRYVRAAITLEISPAVDQETGTAFIEEKTPVLTNWIALYLANLSLEDATGNRNLKRIQSQILDAFNEILFPDVKPQIKQVFFKEFVVQ